MKGDRGLLLLREAHIRRFIDLTQADPFDRHFWIRTGWTLDWLENEHIREVWHNKYALHLSLLDYELDKERFDMHWNQAREAQDEIRALLLPWLDNQGLDTVAARGLYQSWTSLWGDPDDPEVAKRIQATVEALNRRNLALKVPNART